MISAADSLQIIRLKPGEMLISREPCQVTTVLGSCLAVTLFNGQLGLAAICHAMLPCLSARETAGLPPPGKYLNHALPVMFEAFRQARLAPEEIEVKMFGGADVLHHFAPKGQSIGSANIHMARYWLSQERLTIKAANVGGALGRKIRFDTRTGEVLHRFVPPGAIFRSANPHLLCGRSES
jgi:chemotaxis protein CheD